MGPEQTGLEEPGPHLASTFPDPIFHADLAACSIGVSEPYAANVLIGLTTPEAGVDTRHGCVARLGVLG